MIVKQDVQASFENIGKGMPFAAKIVVYTKSRNEEVEKEHFFIKTGKDKATTIDRHVVVHFPSNTPVNRCLVTRKRA